MINIPGGRPPRVNTRELNAQQEPAIRQHAMEWLRMLTHDGEKPLSHPEIIEYAFQGRTISLKGTQGIWTPEGFSAPISIRTTYTRPGETPPYADEAGSDGLLRYAWRGTDPEHRDNRGLRKAMQEQIPLIWFLGITDQYPREFNVMAPVYLIAEEPAQHRFVLGFSADDQPLTPVSNVNVLEEPLRRYILAQTRVRLHQPLFRSTVLRAYDNQCAVCSLKHPPLLDAAHIVPDTHERGAPSVRNGMAMCKIHHAAFDHHFLGITPDHQVQISHDLLNEVDGPMLRHGLQELHGKKLMFLPRTTLHRPDPELLDIAYQQFITATPEDVRL